METELKTIYDSRASFYKKAIVNITEDKEGKTVYNLYSYGTLVCSIQDGEAVVYGTYSNTTLRHIKEFLKQNGFKAENKAQIVEDYKNKTDKE